MNFFQSIETCLKKYFYFSGRASRSEFWYFFLFIVLGGIFTTGLDAIFQLEESSSINSWFALLTLIPSFSVQCRRLHDINRSGWWILIWLTVIGIFLLIYWHIKKGVPKKNKYGEIPLKN